MVYVAFLRGINVGGNNPVSMNALRQSFERLGFDSVRTYINSGNVIFKAPDQDPRALETTIERALETDLSLPLTVVVRNLPEMESVVQRMPKNWTNSAGLRCNVIFLRHEIDNPKVMDGLKPKPGIEELKYEPGVLFWAAKRESLTKSSMVKLSAQPVYAGMTARNERTPVKVLELMREAERASR